MNGWVKIHRMLQSWEWYNDSQTLHVFITILLNANHNDGRWRGHDVKRGQWITGRKKLAEITGISERSIRTILKRLEDSQELTIKPTSMFSVISVVKWDSYQLVEPTIDQPNANERPAIDQPPTTNKKVKKEKKQPTAEFESFWSAFADKRSKEQAWQSWQKIDPDLELAAAIINGAVQYAKQRVNILAKNGTPKMAQGWLTDKRWEDEDTASGVELTPQQKQILATGTAY